VAGPAPIRVLAVDDHQIVRDGLALVIGREPDMTIVASVATGEEAIETYRRERPDLVLMDLQLRTMSGLQAIEGIRSIDPDARIIVLTVYEGDEHIFRALAAGATTYLLKDTLSDDLVRVMREVHAGQKPMNASVQQRLAERQGQPVLTAREVQVLQLVATGNRNKEIAADLKISEETVLVHMKNIFKKLNVSDRTAAVNVAVRRGIVRL
jgi:DNA-binding NarL/FixJ family response regulator